MRQLLFGLIAALSLAALIPWTLKAADSTLSGLSAGGAISGTDLFYDVQTAGVGGVKVTGTQLKTFMSASPSFTGTVTFPDNGTWSAGGVTGTIGEFTTVNIGGIASGTQCLHANATGLVSGTGSDCGNASFSIAAGTNITTSGTASNVTVNVVATPSFTTIIATGNTTGTTGNFTTSLSSGTATFQTVTINNLTPGGPVCLQETGGVVQATNAACGSGSSTTSIAAGTNITTSGTATNVTVNVVATPSFTTVISTSNLTASTVLGVVGWLTAPGVNMQTASIVGNLTGSSANFSSNLTANIAQFAGFMSAGGASLSGLTIQTETLSGNLTGTSANFSSNLTANIAQFAGFLSAGGASLSGLTIQTGTFSGNLTGTSANFSTNLTANIAQFAGFLSAGGASLSGLTIVTATHTGNLTGTSANFSSNLTAATAQITGLLTGTNAVFQTITINNLTPTGPNCLQETNSVVQATNAACGSGSGTPATGGPVLPTSEYLAGASGQLSPQFYIPNTNTIANQGALEGIALATTATATLATAVLQFNMPEVIPTNPMRLRLIYMANATTGNVSTWIQDALTSVSNSLGISALTSETTKVIAITSADVMIEKKFALTQTPTAGSNQILTVLLNLTTSVGQTVVIQPSIIWE